MNKQMYTNLKKWKILTDVGFVDFVGVAYMGNKQMHKISFVDNTYIECAPTHVFFLLNGLEITASELQIGDVILGKTPKIISDISITSVDRVYDIIESSTHTFYANGVLSHNCVFLSNDPLLFDTIMLTNLTEVVNKSVPYGMVGDIVFFEQPQKNQTYLLGADPATGKGNDFTTFEVFSFPALEQVCEWRCNTMNSNLAYTILKKVLLIFEKVNATVYFSIESNGVGEGLISLYEQDEYPPSTSEFISDDGKNKRGMTTTNKSKIRSALAFKEIMERGDITIRSKVLLAEMKNYVRVGGSYAAKIGSTDDLISSMLIIMRLIQEISAFDQKAYETIYQYDNVSYNEEDFDINYEPLPFLI